MSRGQIPPVPSRSCSNLGSQWSIPFACSPYTSLNTFFNLRFCFIFVPFRRLMAHCACSIGIQFLSFIKASSSMLTLPLNLPLDVSSLIAEGLILHNVPESALLIIGGLIESIASLRRELPPELTLVVGVLNLRSLAKLGFLSSELGLLNEAAAACNRS